MMLTNTSPIFWLSLILPLAGIALIMTVRIMRRRHIRQLQTSGLVQLISLKNLLMLVQRHRGMSYSVINGDHSLKNGIAPLEQEIAALMQASQALAEHKRHCEYWSSFSDHWQRLQRNNLSLDAENNREQHNRLIAVLLYLLEDVAECARLNEISQSPQHHLWRDLPRTAEWIGQARVLGTGMLAAGHSDSVQKIRIRFIRSKLAEYIAGQQNSNTTLDTTLEKLVQVIDQQLLQDATKTLAAKEYFDLSTQAIEPYFQRIDQGLKQLQQQQ